MPGQVVSLTSEDALLQDDYEQPRRPRKGKAKSKKRKKLGKRKLPTAVNKRSRIAEAMDVPTTSSGKREG